MACVVPKGEITRLLTAYRSGDPEAFDRLVPLIYAELRVVARGQLRRGRPGQTLDTTSLVHEAYLHLVDERGVDWQSRAHFFAVAARAMRRIIVDYARYRQAEKRGGGRPNLTLDPNSLPVEADAESILAVDRALEGLGQINERLKRVVECRYFAGMTEEETAEALGVSTRTVQRDWMRARAWLQKGLQE